MSDLISRQAAIIALNKRAENVSLKTRIGLLDAVRVIDELPSVEPEREKGKWINVASGSLIDKYICSECKKEPCQKKIDITWGWDFTDYCPNCGADMREVQDGKN